VTKRNKRKNTKSFEEEKFIASLEDCTNDGMIPNDQGSPIYTTPPPQSTVEIISIQWSLWRFQNILTKYLLVKYPEYPF
jgi:hypothetical protein